MRDENRGMGVDAYEQRTVRSVGARTATSLN